MKNWNRREFAKWGAAGAGLAALGCADGSPEAEPEMAPENEAPVLIRSTFGGVTIGAQSYSFRDRPLDEAIEGYKTVGIGLCELWSGHLEPLRGREARQGEGRETMRAWRTGDQAVATCEEAAKKFQAAGVVVDAVNYSFRKDFDDAEIEAGFKMAAAFGAKKITASSNPSMAGRIDKYAQRYEIRVGMHNHSRIHDDEFATPADFDKAREGNSEFIAINLDIGHFVAAGFDPVEYIEKEHGAIVCLHIKDRKKDQGENLPFGEGDTPINEVLALVKDKGYDIPANIEYEYKHEDTIAEMHRCFAYCKEALMGGAVTV